MIRFLLAVVAVFSVVGFNIWMVDKYDRGEDWPPYVIAGEFVFLLCAVGYTISGGSIW